MRHFLIVLSYRPANRPRSGRLLKHSAVCLESELGETVATLVAQHTHTWNVRIEPISQADYDRGLSKVEPENPPKEAKGSRLRVGYGVWAEGASAPSRIHNIRRDHPDFPGQIVAYVDWGYIAYERDEIVKVDAPVLHPQILDSTGTEYGLGSLISGGDDPDGEVVEIVEPDESHWRVRVQWPEFDEPETFDATPPPGGHDEPLFTSDIAAAS